MRGNITLKILEAVGKGLVTTADIVTAILESGYGASPSKMNRSYRQIELRRAKEELHRQKMKSYYNLISKLNRDGFIKTKQKNWLLTLSGKKKFEKLERQIIEHIPRKNYEIRKNNDLTIISFDIPEKEKRKRNWLRDTLSNLDFSMLQKSVWLGKNKIPEEFLKDLRRLEILNYVHIFSVNRTGSITGSQK